MAQCLPRPTSGVTRQMLAKSVKTGTFVWGCAGFDGVGAALTGVGMLWAI
ncbi:MAG: hypothetical protein GQ539_00935 [Sulfitobacter sp.]|nr:hypothetical protein [Sulfitobacter sp.]